MLMHIQESMEFSFHQMDHNYSAIQQSRFTSGLLSLTRVVLLPILPMRPQSSWHVSRKVISRLLSGKMDKEWRTHPQDHAVERKRFEHYRSMVESGTPLRATNPDIDDRQWMKTAGLLTGKPLLLVANVSGEREAGALIQLCAEREQSSCVSLDADLELELAAMDRDERKLFMEELEITSLGLDRLTRAAFDLLGLITFYTVVKDKLQAWEIPSGTPAAVAAGRIHSDMERGFIRAEVVTADELCETGDLHAIRSRGHLKTVGREYEVKDGDVMEFLFNV